jgi:hypothetical protein
MKVTTTNTALTMDIMCQLRQTPTRIMTTPKKLPPSHSKGKLLYIVETEEVVAVAGSLP